MFTKQGSQTISLLCSRKLLNTLVKNYLWLFDVSKEETEKELHIKKMTNMIIKQNSRKEQSGTDENKQKKFHTTVSESTSQIIISHKQEQRKQSAVTQQNISACLQNLYNTVKVDIPQVDNLIISIKVHIDASYGTVNVHLSKNTTAKDILAMVLNKVN